VERRAIFQKYVEPEEASHPQKKSQTLTTMNEQMEANSDLDDPLYTLFLMGSQAGTPIQVTLTVNQKPLTMELDTGASYSLISEQMYKATCWPGRDAPVLQQSSVKLHTYIGEQVEVVGSITVTVTVCYNTQVVELPLLVVKEKGPSLFAHNWLSKIKLDWSAINHVTSQLYKKVIDKYPDVFKDELGALQGARAKIHVDPQATPRFFKPR